MRRHPITILIFLLLGTLLNITIAWACALCLTIDPTLSSWVHFSDGLSYSRSDEPADDYCWFVWKYQRPAACRILSRWEQPSFLSIYGDGWRTSEEVLAGCAHWRVIDCQSTERSSRAAVLDARGWPFLSWSSLVYCECSPGPSPLLSTASPLTQHTIAQAYADCDFQVEWGLALPRPDDSAQHWVAGNYVLPLRPLWPGFAINTLLYAAILWLLIRGPFVLRIRSRRRRGCCLKCGYDLRGDYETGCPECGWNRGEAAP